MSPPSEERRIGAELVERQFHSGGKVIPIGGDAGTYALRKSGRIFDGKIEERQIAG